MARRQNETKNERLLRLIEEGKQRTDVMPCFVGHCVWPATCKASVINGEVVICLRTGRAPTRVLPPKRDGR